MENYHCCRGYEMIKTAVTKQLEKKVGYETAENTGKKLLKNTVTKGQGYEMTVTQGEGSL